MPLSSFSSSNVSNLHSSLSTFNLSLTFSIHTCLKSPENVFLLMGFSVASFLLLPLYILVLCVGHQRWRKQRSAVAPVTTSHSDFLTYNMIAMEMISMVGNCFCCYGTFSGVHSVMVAGLYMSSIASPGQNLLHVLTCVERYLAVVHPIIYLGLKQSDGIKIRNIVTLCVWIACFVCMHLTEEMVSDFSTASAACFLVFSFSTVAFCSISVICVLNRPRPGDGSGERERVDHLKQRAVNTIMVILAALLFRFVGNLSCIVLYSLAELQEVKCQLLISSLWFSLPSSLVLPLLYLHRAKKLPG
ncbi:hypothetical protein Q5P01_002952 [Channa striata]|uniref:G-protein coupled receptors family 1 profile domain-containing protein n=1 Tax=Channa striata TaxID=64152 RepID=A0AA88T8L1_CHASR|nr:hypothetical protein Q5P01_002952 [Channa striata]